jgi:hypothetical protein
MSDLGIIIPVAIVAVIALALGSSSGVSNPDQFDDWELDTPMDYARKLSMDLGPSYDPHGAQYDKAWGTPPKIFAGDFKSKTEIRFDNDTESWELHPQRGKNIVEKTTEIQEEVSQGLQEISAVRKGLTEKNDRDVDLEEELERRLTDYENRYYTRNQRFILTMYQTSVDNVEHEITFSLTQKQKFKFTGGIDYLTRDERGKLVQTLTNLSQGLRRFKETNDDELSMAREAIRISKAMDDVNTMLHGSVPVEEVGGYAESTTNVQFQHPQTPSNQNQFSQAPQSSLNRIPASAPPDLHNPDGIFLGTPTNLTSSVEATPLNLTTRIQGMMRNSREESSNLPAPRTPPRKPSPAPKSSPDFSRLAPQVIGVINRTSFPPQEEETFSEDTLDNLMDDMQKREAETQELRNVTTPETTKPKTSMNRPKPKRPTQPWRNKDIEKVKLVFDLSKNDEEIFYRELDQIQRALDIASGNQDQRGILRVREMIEMSAPPGTERGALYKARRDMTVMKIGSKKIDFSEVKNDKIFREWERVFDNVEQAHI